MYSRLIVGNFKAIRETVEIDLRPITLLFGPNAAGKSSVLHAVHYLAELLRGGPRDVHQRRSKADIHNRRGLPAGRHEGR